MPSVVSTVRAGGKKLEIRGRRLRVSFFSSKSCIRGSLRTQDVGRKGRSLRVACRTRRSGGDFETQSMTFLVADIRRGDPATIQSLDNMGVLDEASDLVTLHSARLKRIKHKRR